MTGSGPRGTAGLDLAGLARRGPVLGELASVRVLMTPRDALEPARPIRAVSGMVSFALSLLILLGGRRIPELFGWRFSGVGRGGSIFPLPAGQRCVARF